MEKTIRYIIFFTVEGSMTCSVFASNMIMVAWRQSAMEELNGGLANGECVVCENIWALDHSLE